MFVSSFFTSCSTHTRLIYCKSRMTMKKKCQLSGETNIGLVAWKKYEKIKFTHFSWIDRILIPISLSCTFFLIYLSVHLWMTVTPSNDDDDFCLNGFIHLFIYASISHLLPYRHFQMLNFLFHFIIRAFFHLLNYIRFVVVIYVTW